MLKLKDWPTRRYARSLEDVPAGVRARGTSRSAVSRRFVAATEQQMATWLGRDLGEIDLVVLMVDGVHVDDHVVLAALGIDSDGKKHVLGIREGASENATACTALLGDLRERCMRTGRCSPCSTGRKRWPVRVTCLAVFGPAET